MTLGSRGRFCTVMTSHLDSEQAVLSREIRLQGSAQKSPIAIEFKRPPWLHCLGYLAVVHDGHPSLNPRLRLRPSDYALLP